MTSYCSMDLTSASCMSSSVMQRIYPARHGQLHGLMAVGASQDDQSTNIRPCALSRTKGGAPASPARHREITAARDSGRARPRHQRAGPASAATRSSTSRARSRQRSLRVLCCVDSPASFRRSLSTTSPPSASFSSSTVCWPYGRRLRSTSTDAFRLSRHPRSRDSSTSPCHCLSGCGRLAIRLTLRPKWSRDASWQRCAMSFRRIWNRGC